MERKPSVDICLCLGMICLPQTKNPNEKQLHIINCMVPFRLSSNQCNLNRLLHNHSRKLLQGTATKSITHYKSTISSLFVSELTSKQDEIISSVLKY